MPPFDLSGEVVAAPVVTECLAYYGIDFENRLAGVTRRSGRFECGGEQIVAHCYRPPREPRGTVFLLHGYFDHVGLYRHPIRWCLEHDFAVLAWDLPGHGLSTGPRASIDSFHRYVATLVRVLELGEPLPRPWHAMGQSTGGAVLMEFLLGRGLTVATSPFEELVLFAPLVRPAGWRSGRVIYQLAHRFINELPRKFQPNSENAKFLDFLRHRDPLQPRFLSVEWVGAMREWMLKFLAYPPSDLSPLVFQGMQDFTVDWRYNLQVLQEKFSFPEIVYLPTARHHLVNEAEDNRARIFRRLDERFGFGGETG